MSIEIIKRNGIYYVQIERGEMVWRCGANSLSEISKGITAMLSAIERSNK